MTYPPEIKNKFIEMRAEGRTMSDIAKELGIAHNTATAWNVELSENVDSAKAFKVEEMLEKYRMTKEKRIEMFGEWLLVLQAEFANRDLSEVPANKIFDMIIKCEKALGAEISYPMFLTDGDIEDKKNARDVVERDAKCVRDILATYKASQAAKTLSKPTASEN
jgi:transposase-like protein